MNRTFSRILKGGSKISKYLVFSFTFVLAFILGANRVGAANTDYPYSNNDELRVTSGSCAASGLPNSYLSYVLKSSNYKGNPNDCVAYVYPESATETTKYFYLKGEDTHILTPNTTNLQTIQFTISTSDVGTFKYVAIFEATKTLGSLEDLESAASYDLYTMDGTTPSYSLIEPASGGHNNSTYHDPDKGIDKGYFTYDSSVLTFSYAMRNPKYGLNSVYIYFYDDQTDQSNITKRTEVSFYFAKPISDFESQSVTTLSSCDLTVSTTGKICLVYSNLASPTTAEKDISVYFPKNAAFYFSTVNNHEADPANPSDTHTEADIQKYNSIYAINTFENVDGTVVKYMYYNLTDDTDYTDDTNNKINVEGTSYAMRLTMDANGSYVFTITDVFGTSNTTTSAPVVVTDTSKRDIDIFFLRESNSSAAADVHKNNDNNGDGTVDSADFFEITDRDSLTKNNVDIYIELFFTVLIEDKNATHVSTSQGIKSNPLDSDSNGELDVNASSYCKLYVTIAADGSRTYECLTSTQTNYKSHKLTGTQIVPATYEGLNSYKSTALTDVPTCASGTDDFSIGCIKNNFTFSQGTVNIASAIAVEGTSNKSFVWVNENGSYQFIVQDIYGNSENAWIDVSIIDQLQPTITFDNTITSNATKLCTSTYVYGGNSGYAASIFTKVGDGTGQAAYDCSAQSVVYDVTTNSTATNYIKEQSTGRDTTATRFLLETKGGDSANLIYYNSNGSRDFSYADAIRIARLTTVDSITKLAAKDSASKTTTNKSIYTHTNATFTEYSLTALAIETNAAIIGGNYLQYASELTTFADIHSSNQLQILIEVNGSKINFGSDTICNSAANATTCYNYVNNYIDRGIDFKIVFRAIDFTGNISNDYTINVDVVDDTSAGVINVNPETGVISDAKPDIQLVNIDTLCRLEVGNYVQLKRNILDCYGFATLDGTTITRFNFADNKSGRINASGSVSNIGYDHTNFGNVLSYQWYTAYTAHDVNIEVQILVGETWTTLADGTADSARNIYLEDAGYYKIKFIITDNKLTSGTSGDPLTNTTTLITWYYVNPKILLIAPHAQTHEYGTATSTLTYDIYTSANDQAFHTNMYDLDPKDLPEFLKNYEVADTSDNDFLILTGRSMAGSLKVIGTKRHDDASYGNGGIWTEDANYHTYINTPYSIDAGSYYITLGDLYVSKGSEPDTQNYIIRLHPAYLINGKTPDSTLENYDNENVEENVSSVHLIIKQKQLYIEANGGTKMYGVLDTNYQYYATTDAVTNSNNSLAYLNGYTVTSGFASLTVGSTELINDSVNTTYTAGSIIVGSLRRQAGEKVGTYSICNFDVRNNDGSIKNPTDYTNASSCGSSDVGKWGIKAAVVVTIATNNVYYLKTDGTYSNTGLTVTEQQIADGALVGYYVKHTDGKYYKITATNTDSSDRSKLSVDTDTWLITYDNVVYDDTNDALQISVNNINGNQNYVISYTTASYTITTRELVIQPGVNQGKEYSTPAHKDPIWQLIVYGEMEDTIRKAASGFNGYTVDIGLEYDDTTPTTSDYLYGIEPETSIYFNRRKKTPADGVYNYQYKITIVDSVFTLDGVDYKVESDTKICRNTGATTELECYEATDGVFTIGGINKLVKDGSNIVVTITGNLVYQNYTLFMKDGGTAGSGYITREAGENVAWYAYKNDLTNLLPVHDNLSTTGANYTTSYNDNAPSYTVATKTYLTLQGTATNEYMPDGEHACSSGVEGQWYSKLCTSATIKPSTVTSKQILFEIFKRDIVIAFNYVDDAYGYAYADYKAWYFDFTSTNNGTPINKKYGTDIITCFMRASEGGTGTKYVVNNVEYVIASTCSDSDQGLAEDDSWGTTGTNSLGLSFKLALADNELFNKESGSVYALPAGLHYVHASITNENYRLVYVDYYAIEQTQDLTFKGGAVDVLPSKVTLNATSYQKEYGQAIYDTYNDNGTWTTSKVNIFDLNYVGCVIASGADNVGCGYNLGTTGSQTATATEIAGLGSQNEKNKYNSLANIYGYTIVANTGYVIAGEYASRDHSLTVITDTIYNNFSGLPLRDRGNYASYNSDDKYGLLDGAGRYTISLANIAEIYAKYTSDDKAIFKVGAPKVGENAEVSKYNDATPSTTMITRYTNYEIVTPNSGTLYILPARIDIEVADDQTKMYGCAYNGPTSTPSWTRDGGYADCDEAIADYYDFGYTYKVYGDKTFELLDNSSAKLKGYTLFNVANTIADFGSVDDVKYGTDQATKVESYTVEGIVTAHANATDKNNVSYKLVGGTTKTINNSALNNGVLYRAILETGNTESEYSYSNYWKYANDALTKTSGKYNGFQNQGVGTYVLTLGNLDAVFNKNNHCNVTSDPTSDGANNCKNFIVYKVDDDSENNTSTHTKAGSTESISNADLKHTYSSEFTITTREVKLHTEYNYKVYGDTDSLEGFTCAQIAAMYTRTSGYNSGATFSFTGRDFGCSSADTTFINMGTSRYYAVDNSLAKAPWTKWSDDRQVTTVVTSPSSYYLYDDILWDIVRGLLARTNENGNKSADYNNTGINDKVGKYTYDWSSVALNDSDNYTQAILTATKNTNDYVAKNNLTTVDQGFYTLDANNVTQRWYLDTRHNQVNKETKSDYDYYSFIIKKTADAAAADAEFGGNYPFATIDKEYGEVYYEVVKREIIIVVDDVNKDYGIEDTYALFTVKLCSEYDADTKTCTLLEKDQAYGNRTALSKDDYTWFINNDGSYNQEHIKGYTSTTGVGRFVGSATKNESAATRGSFGVYYYRAAGEEIGTYTVKACPTQLASGNPNCTGDNGEVFDAGTDGTNYNAANYIITSYVGSLTIDARSLLITPDSGQGFQYGNYETGTKIAPITYTESYTGVALNNGANGYNSATATNGLVNGDIGVDANGDAISDDSLAKQYSLCLFDITGKNVICLNDRQNKTLDKSSQNKAYTTQYVASSNPTNAMPTGLTATWVYNNVYNDDYTVDNDDSRFALDRVIGGTTASQRYNRNVGVYTIVAGELKADGETVCANDEASNCLNSNYDITGFATEPVTFAITAASIVIEVESGQEKIYGQKDVELNFSVTTTFTTDELPVDYYYCGANQDTCKQKFTKKGETSYAGSVEVSFSGFAYGEDLTADDYNYGESKQSNKSAVIATANKVNQSTIEGLRYFDKYCLTGTSGSYVTTFDEFVCAGTYDGYNTTNVSVTYKSTGGSNRILLGYLYVEGWAQTAGTHNIFNGMVVANNEHGNKNYTINYDVTDNKDTGVDFEINKLELEISIENITKTYGEATDAYKCENGNCRIRDHEDDNTLLTALNNENRLEFNFNVVNTGNSEGVSETGVEDKDTSDPTSVIYLTTEINGKYYTHTAAAETKNVHLGLTVARAKEAATADNKCSVSNDLFGCEDATDANGYELRFVHSLVTDTVDANYKLFIDDDEVVIPSEGNTDTTYVAITRGASKDTQKSSFESTDTYVGGDYRGKLVINKRDITFYIGTYNSAELVDERFTIEQNEMLPNMPVIVDASIGYVGQMSKDDLSATDNTNNHVTNPAERQVYYITWFDNVDPEAVYARQVRTADTITSTITPADDATYGIAYCKTPIATMTGVNSVNDVTVTNCGSTNVIYASRANTQENGAYVFDTSVIGVYAMIRDRNYTGVTSNSTYVNDFTNAKYEAKNYTTTDVNGTLVIYEDKTAPTIEVPTDMQYTFEANADVTCTTVSGNTTCTVSGKQVGVNEDQWSLDTLGNAIKYLTQNYSNFTLNGVTVTDENTMNKLVAGDLVDTIASENGTAFGAYCKKVDATGSGCTELFISVNNPGVTSKNSNITTYATDRTTNTYNWDGTVINDNLRAVSSIISWFNITSYDYGYIRENEYVTKRYTPRYYIFINGSTDNNLDHFDPRYVGDFTISIYAVDNIGNVSDATTVTLHIKDETKPVSGSLYLFNTQVKCKDGITDKLCATDINNWIVDTSTTPLVHINSFVKYKQSGGNYVIDDVNGTFIYVNNAYKSLYGGITRYNSSGNADVTGMYIKLTSSDTVSALQVEHRYWNNTNTVYAVVLGGSDNSYMNKSTTSGAIDDALSQWENYYRIGTSWYEYTRTTKSGVAITTQEGINEVVIAAIDSGRKVTSAQQAHNYYDALYLMDTNGSCSDIDGCNDTALDETIVRDVPVITSGKFTILGTVFTVDATNNKVTWGTNGSADITDNKFTAGIVTCTFTDNTYTSFDSTHNCVTDYKVVYKDGDKKSVNVNNFKTTTASLNISDLDTSADSLDTYYRDRKYVFIDKNSGSMTMISEGYKIYEFGCTGCDKTYDEPYLTYNDKTSVTKGSLSVSGTAITNSAQLAKFAEITGYTIKGYTGSASEAKPIADVSRTYSGIASFTTSEGVNTYVNVMNGTNTDTSSINYFYTQIRVYLGIRTNGNITYFKYVILWNGASFDVYRVSNTAPNNFALVGDYSATTKINVGTITTIEEVLEKIVSTDASVKANAVTNDTEYQFDINYSIYDVAGNLSGTIVRGITFVKLSSSIKVSVSQDSPAAANLLSENEGNSYSLRVNQGVSLKTLLTGFSISNIDNDGVNNMSSVRQSLYYNGEAIFENMAYNPDVLMLIDDYAATPGTYTLRLTSTRNVASQGVNYLVDDTPLEINFVVDPATAIVETTSDYSTLIVPIILIGFTSLFLLGLGYISIRKMRKND